MAAGPGVTGIEGWRVALLLVGFIVVTLSFEGLIDHVEKRLKKRKGLLTAFRALKNELLYLGFLSLLLSVTQEYLARICIPQTSGSSYIKYKLKYSLVDNCAAGKEPLWPVSVQHETHYFIFAVAVTHILYCALTIALTLHKVSTWRPWEDEALEEAKSSSGDVKVMQETVSRSLIRSMCTAALAGMSGHRSASLDLVAHAKALGTSVAAQFRVSVSHPMYHNVRLLFIERMGLAYDFDFHALVTNGMENQLAHAVHASWPLWMIATFFLVLPTPSYVPFWSYCLVMVLMLVVGAKLVSVTALLGMQVAIKYGDSVLFGRMDLEPRALVRTGPARRRMSLSQLADSLGDVVDGAVSGVFSAEGTGDGGPGGSGAGAGGEGAVAAAHAGAHVLDEALPVGAGAEVQLQVAAITALTSRQEALNLLRTMAATPLLPEVHSPPPGPRPHEGLELPPLPRPDAAAAAAVATAAAPTIPTVDDGPAGVAGAAAAATQAPASLEVPSPAASTPKLMVSPSLLLGIAPPRWGPRPSAAAALPMPSAPTTGPSPPRAVHNKKKHHPPPPPPIRLPSHPPLSDIQPLSPILYKNTKLMGADVSTSTAASPLSATGSISPLPTPTTPGSNGAKPMQDGGGCDVKITVLGSNETTMSGGAVAAIAGPTTSPGASAAAAMMASVRPSAIALPHSASRPSTAAVPGISPLSVLLPSTGTSSAVGIAPPFVATMRTGSRGLNAVAAAAVWANSTARRNASRPSAGLMLCGVATSRVTNALEQMEEAMAIAATAAELSAEQYPDLPISPPATSITNGGGGGVPTATGEVRPTTPSGVRRGMAVFLASLRPSRVRRETDDVRPLVDGSRSAKTADGGIHSPRVTVRQGSRLATTLTGTTGHLTSPLTTDLGAVEGGGGSDTSATAMAAAAAAAIAAARLMRQLPPRCPIRRCMSARQLMHTTHIAEEDFSRTLVRRQAAATNNATIANSVGGTNGKAIVIRPGGVQDDSGLGLQVGMELLPTPHFGSSSTPPPPPPPITQVPKFSTERIPIGFFGPRKKVKKAQRQSGNPTEMTVKTRTATGDGDCASTRSDNGGGNEPEAPKVVSEAGLAAKVPYLEQEQLSVTAVAAEVSGVSLQVPLPSSAGAAIAVEDASVSEKSQPEPSAAAARGALGAFAPRPRGAAASAFAMIQVRVQQGPGDAAIAGAGGAADYSSVYDSLSALLPPVSPSMAASMLPGFVRATSNCSGVGASSPPPEIPQVDSTSPGSRVADAAHGRVPMSTIAEAGANPHTCEVAASAATLPEPLVEGGVQSVAVSPAEVPASSLRLPSPPELGSSPGALSRPCSGLRVVRMGHDGPWISVDEAVAMAMGDSTMKSMMNSTDVSREADAAMPSELMEYGSTAYEYGNELEAPVPSSSSQRNARLLLPNTSKFREAASLQMILPLDPRGGRASDGGGVGSSTDVGDDARAHSNRIFASVFSMHASASLDSHCLQPALQPELTPITDSPRQPGDANASAGIDDTIRTAASMRGSGVLHSAELEQTYIDNGDGLQAAASNSGGYGPTAAAVDPYISNELPDGVRQLTLGGSALLCLTTATAVASAAKADFEMMSTRAEADLPSTPSGTAAMPMIPHTLDTVMEADEEEAAAEEAKAELEEAETAAGLGAASYEEVVAVEVQGQDSGSYFSNADGAHNLVAESKSCEFKPPPPHPLAASPLQIVKDDEVTSGCNYARQGSLGDNFFRRDGSDEQTRVQAQEDSQAANFELPNLESTFAGFGIVDFNRTAERIVSPGMALRDLPTPPRMPSRTTSIGSQGMRASSSALSLLSLAPWAGDEGSGPGSGSGSEYVSRAPSEAADRPRLSSGSGTGSRPDSASTSAVAEGGNGGRGGRSGRGGSRSTSRLGMTSSRRSFSGQDEEDTMPSPPAAPAAPPASPPPPVAYLHQRIGAAFNASDSCAAAENSRWAVSVAPSIRGGSSRGALQRIISSSATSIPEIITPATHSGVSQGKQVSIQSWDEPWAGPVCEGSGALGGENAAVGTSAVVSADDGGGGGGTAAVGPAATTAATTFTSTLKGESLRTTAAGIAAAQIWRDQAMETHEQRRNASSTSNVWQGNHSYVSLLERIGGHHHHHSRHNHHNHSGHGSDSESDDGGCCHTCWPPCVPKPWHHHPRVTPLPAPVRDLKDNLSAGMDKAKVALASAAGDVADTVKGKLLGKKHHQVSKQLQRKISDHWLERVRNMLAAHKGFETMDASAFFWFHNPKVIAYLFNWAYYENSLSIAILLFSLILGYQDKWVFKGVRMWAVLLLLLADLLILVHSCLYVLPLYALIMPVGAHCPKEVLRRALKAGVFTRQTALIAKALHLQLKARENIASAAAASVAPPTTTLVDRITQGWRKRSMQQPTVTVATAVRAFSRAAQNGLLARNGPAAPSGAASALSPASVGGLHRMLSPPGGGGSGGDSDALSPHRDMVLSPRAPVPIGLVGVDVFALGSNRKKGNGGGGGSSTSGDGTVVTVGVEGSYNTSLKVIDLTDSGLVGDKVLLKPMADVVYGSDVVKPAVLPRKDSTAVLSSTSTSLMNTGSGGGSNSIVPPAWPGPKEAVASEAEAAAAFKASQDLRQPEGTAAIDRLSFPEARGGANSSRTRQGDGATVVQQGNAPSRFSRLLKPFRAAAAVPPVAAAAAVGAEYRTAGGGGAAQPRDASSHHSFLSNPDDAVMPFTVSGTAPSPSGSMTPGAMTATVAATATAAAASTSIPPQLGIQGAAATATDTAGREAVNNNGGSGGGGGGSLLDLSLMRGADLERMGSRDSLSSSLGRSGTIRTLMAGMYRGAVIHLNPEERRAAAASSAALGRAAAAHGRPLDMTLVPEKGL